jgi:YD repeat-containing protein
VLLAVSETMTIGQVSRDTSVSGLGEFPPLGERLGPQPAATAGPSRGQQYLNASNLTAITDPNERTGGPDAGTNTTITYNTAGQVTTQTDPMGYATSYTWTGFNPATGNGIITTTDPDGNKTVTYYVQGTLAAQSAWTGGTLTSE